MQTKNKSRLSIVFLIIIFVLSTTALAGPAKSEGTNPATQPKTTAHQTKAFKTPALPDTDTASFTAEQSALGLGIGDRGEQVILLQKLLAEQGFYPGTVDGIFGEITRAGVSNLQKAYSLPVTGIADKIAFAYLDRSRGTPDRYRRVMVMTATAYTTEDPGCTNYTYRGNLLRKGLVAVDPGTIPLGTRLYVEGYGYAVADDTGSAIKGSKIDLAYESRRDAFQFGVQKVNVYILD